MKKLMYALIAFLCAGSIMLAAPSTLLAETTNEETCTGANFNLNDPRCKNAAKEEACAGVNLDGQAGCQDSTPALNGLITSVINLASVGMGILAVIMLVYAGLKYVFSGGDTSQITSAKNTLIYAVFGLVLVALAQVIVHFVVNKIA